MPYDRFQSKATLSELTRLSQRSQKTQKIDRVMVRNLPLLEAVITAAVQPQVVTIMAAKTPIQRVDSC